MKILGITGSSGAGKTTLSKILNKNQDIKIIDADKIAKELSVPGTEYLTAIKNAFGEEILLEDGNLNRKLLGYKIYNNNECRKKLNKLTFNYVLKEILKRIEQTDKKVRIVVIDAPLLFESGLDKCCDYVVSLIADTSLKIERICKRDNIDEETAKSRLNIQPEDSYYIEKSDFIIENDRNCNLKDKIKKILDEIIFNERKIDI